MRQQLPQFTIKTNLKQSEEFDDNHDNDNYSDYIEDVSVHTRRLISEWVCGSEDLSELARIALPTIQHRQCSAQATLARQRLLEKSRWLLHVHRERVTIILHRSLAGNS